MTLETLFPKGTKIVFGVSRKPNRGGMTNTDAPFFGGGGVDQTSGVSFIEPQAGGFTYLVNAEDNNGKTIPLKMNARALTEEEAGITTTLIEHLVKGKHYTAKVEGMEGVIEGLSYRQALSMLIDEGPGKSGRNQS